MSGIADGTDVLVDLQTGVISLVVRASEADKAEGGNDIEIETCSPTDSFIPIETFEIPAGYVPKKHRRKKDIG